MKKLEYTIDINAPKESVWKTMLAPNTYREWTNVSWPGSTYQGTWAKGEDVKFASPGQGGTMATIVEYDPYRSLLAKHVAILNPDGSEDRTSDVAKGWIGTLERYTFTEHNGKTTLTVNLETTPEWAPMFNEGWPGALEELKKICER
jgi:uncharacterized protein YndB with AHSA1/START domain